MNNDALAVAFKSADTLHELMEAITRTLWTHYERQEAIKALRAEHKLNKKIIAEGKKNADMQKKIAETERENKEALAKGEMPATFLAMVNKVSKAAAKAAIEEHKKNARKKFWGAPKSRR